MKGILITTDGECSICEPCDYDHLSKMVGGWIECVSLKDHGDMFINEEGKLLGLPINDVATSVANKFGNFDRFFDLIVGNAVVVGPVDIEGSSTEVTEIVIQYFKNLNLI